MGLETSSVIDLTGTYQGWETLPAEFLENLKPEYRTSIEIFVGEFELRATGTKDDCYFLIGEVEMQGGSPSIDAKIQMQSDGSWEVEACLDY